MRLIFMLPVRHSPSLKIINSSMCRSCNTLTTPQCQQQHARQAFRDLALNSEESPHRRPATQRPESLTPQPGYVERTRASHRALNRETRVEDLLCSPCRRHALHSPDENVPGASSLSYCRASLARNLVGDSILFINDTYSILAIIFDTHTFGFASCTTCHIPCSASSYRCPTDSCRILVIPAESGGIWRNQIWQRHQPK